VNLNTPVFFEKIRYSFGRALRWCYVIAFRDEAFKRNHSGGVARRARLSIT